MEKIWDVPSVVWVHRGTGKVVPTMLPGEGDNYQPLDLADLKQLLFPGKNKFEIANLGKLDEQFMNTFMLLQGAGISCKNPKGDTLLAFGVDQLIVAREGLHSDNSKLRDQLQAKTNQVIEYMEALARERGKIQDVQASRDQKSVDLMQAEDKIKRLEAKVKRLENSERIARQKLRSANEKLAKASRSKGERPRFQGNEK